MLEMGFWYVVLLIAVWTLFAFYFTPRIIAYFLANRDLKSSKLAQTIGDYFIERMMSWAAEEKNRDKLDKVLRNALSTEAVGIAIGQGIEMAKQHFVSYLEGKAGAAKKDFIKELERSVPESMTKMLDHPTVSKFLDGVQVFSEMLTAINSLRGKKA